MVTLAQGTLTPEDQVFIDKEIGSHRGRPGALLSVLEAVQRRNPANYLPMDSLRYIALKTGTTPSRIYSVVTFYALFNLQPQGENTICICRGTACHTRGSRNLLQSVQLDLGLGMEEESAENDGNTADKMVLTTADNKFTVRTVACFGQCALAPVVEVNHRICGHVSERTLQREILTIRSGE
jgi:NADH-quinone oxidoreductase subunit E